LPHAVTRRSLPGVLTLLVLGVTLACSKAERTPGPPPQRAFYYWRTTFAPTPAESAALTDLGVTSLYLRVFDIDEQGEVAGGLTMAPDARVPSNLEVIPVVFVRHAAFEHVSAETLAQRVWDETVRRYQPFGTPRALQFDCDWTDGTQGPFFAFVRAVKARAPGLATSATIRLHQVKYRERTGVPPVERGMLMFYNMGEVGRGDAIYNAEAAAKYTERISDYPLPLDVALPLWAWTVHLRDGVVRGLMQTVDATDMTQDFLVPAGPDRWTATRTAFFRGELLAEGDVLEVETITPEAARAAARQVAPHLRPERRSVALFDLAERNLTRHDPSSLAALFDSVR
jgi:hypothetical protein